MLSRITRREVRSDGSSSEYVADDSECNSRDTDQHQLEIKAPKAATVSPRRATPTDSQEAQTAELRMKDPGGRWTLHRTGVADSKYHVCASNVLLMVLV